MKFTEILGLKKPDNNDLINIEDFNENADILERMIGTILDRLSNIEREVSEISVKIGELINVSKSLGENGYLRFPTIFGGLLLQWGTQRIYFQNVSAISYDFAYPISFNERPFITIASTSKFINAQSEVNSWKMNTAAYNVDLATASLEAYNVSGEQLSETLEISWFSIGK